MCPKGASCAPLFLILQITALFIIWWLGVIQEVLQGTKMLVWLCQQAVLAPNLVKNKYL
jgi:hypothetical protein